MVVKLRPPPTAMVSRYFLARSSRFEFIIVRFTEPPRNNLRIMSFLSMYMHVVIL
jgi:hypothetical protein